MLPVKMGVAFIHLSFPFNRKMSTIGLTSLY